VPYTKSKRTTVPDGIWGPMRPPGPPVKRAESAGERRITAARVAHVAAELLRERRRLRHRPTMAQVGAMARLEGREPCSYRLDRAVNWLPESLPVGFPYGASGLCFAHQGGEVVVLPDGAGFALA
jgi:hypothetical protein